MREGDIEDDFLRKLTSLKYIHRRDIRDRASLEKNFREKFEALGRWSCESLLPATRTWSVNCTGPTTESLGRTRCLPGCSGWNSKVTGDDTRRKSDVFQASPKCSGDRTMDDLREAGWQLLLD